jgi:hypothetical protein
MYPAAPATSATANTTRTTTPALLTTRAAPEDRLGRLGHAPRSPTRQAKHRHPGEHLEQEDLLLQDGDDGGKVPDEVGQEEEAQHIETGHEMGHELRIDQEAHDPERGDEQQDLPQPRHRARQRRRVDPEGQQDREQQRRRDGATEHEHGGRRDLAGRHPEVGPPTRGADQQHQAEEQGALTGNFQRWSQAN